MSHIVFDIDTQKDLFEKKTLVSNDYVIDNIEKILIHALRSEIIIVGSVIAHTNPFGYCSIGTIGQEKIKETMMVDFELYYNVPLTNNGIDLNVAQECWQIVFEKQHPDIWHNSLGQPDNLNTFLRFEEVDTVTIVGNNFDNSVLFLIKGLVELKYNVEIVVDAINNFNVEDYYPELLSLGGITLISTSEFLNSKFA